MAGCEPEGRSLTHRLQNPGKRSVSSLTEQHKPDKLRLAMLDDEVPHDFECRLCCTIHRVTVHPGADCGKRDARTPVLTGQFEACAIGRGEQFRFAALTAVPDRADRVEDVLRFQPAGRCRDRTCRVNSSVSDTGVARTDPARTRPAAIRCRPV